MCLEFIYQVVERRRMMEQPLRTRWCVSCPAPFAVALSSPPTTTPWSTSLHTTPTSGLVTWWVKLAVLSLSVSLAHLSHFSLPLPSVTSGLLFFCTSLSLSLSLSQFSRLFYSVFCSLDIFIVCHLCSSLFHFTL